MDCIIIVPQRTLNWSFFVITPPREDSIRLEFWKGLLAPWLMPQPLTACETAALSAIALSCEFAILCNTVGSMPPLVAETVISLVTPCVYIQGNYLGNSLEKVKAYRAAHPLPLSKGTQTMK